MGSEGEDVTTVVCPRGPSRGHYTYRSRGHGAMSPGWRYMQVIKTTTVDGTDLRVDVSINHLQQGKEARL